MRDDDGISTGDETSIESSDAPASTHASDAGVDFEPLPGTPTPASGGRGGRSTHQPESVGDSRVRAPSTIPPALGDSRYTVLELIAGGGQGDVWRVNDAVLRRDLALKVVRHDASAGARARFAYEIERTVRLAHPGIVPVFDRGTAADGRPWFAMKRVEGAHLGDVVDAIFGGQRKTGLRRLIELLGRICDAVAHAHAHDILHRDLKPRNIMVGRYGEALVMDWGLARDLPRGRARPRPRVNIRPAGTKGFIAPECYADPGRLDPRSDVFGLGAILFKVLTGAEPSTRAGWVPLRSDFPRRWADRQALPSDLIEVCVQACAADPEQRIQTAQLLRQRLIEWLDGARRRDEALRLVADAREMVEGIAEQRLTVEQLRRQAAEALDQIPAYTPATAKIDGWALQDRARREADELAMAELAFEKLLGAALTRVPELLEAHDLLADHHKARLLDAEARRDRVTARRAESLLVTHDRGSHTEWLAGDGWLTLRTEPPDARVALHRLVNEHRRLVPGPVEVLAQTPIVRRRLPRGSYLALLEAPGFAPVRYPVFIERGTHWDGMPPGAERPEAVALPPEGQLGPDEVYVPPGWAILGGDGQASSGLARCRLWVDGFVIQRFSVTHRQWIAFLDDIEGRIPPDEWLRLLPRHRDESEVYARGADGALYPVDDLGRSEVSLDVPVSLVDWHAATRYAGWLAERTGHGWRLPSSYEWEKAARGVDGRLLPWGDEPEPSWSRTLDSFDGPPGPVTVGECPEDESVFGARDMAATVRNWCINSFRREPPADHWGRIVPAEGELREVRGGTWSSRPALCRPAGRFASRADQRFRAIGVRLVYSWPAGS